MRDRFRADVDIRPSIDKRAPDVRSPRVSHRPRVHAVYLDTSGEPLFKRGYRTEAGEAPLRENLAAALLYLVGWPELSRAGVPLLDPMCGAGTLPIEAAMMAARPRARTGATTSASRSSRGSTGPLWQRMKQTRARSHQDGAVRAADLRAATSRRARVAQARNPTCAAAQVDAFVRVEAGGLA